ncbi:MAG: aminotransferase class V-fold PLP-dependent enzyme [Chromatiales bacterium]|nr:aminotransferase class V-fold PLP-dependent enzyme [Chromatiales bacterium]
MPFQLSSDVIYLNHAAVAPWPVETAEAVRDFAQENQTYGATHYPAWMVVESELRELAAWLLNAPSPEAIALLKSTSEALSVVARGLSWESGDNIVSFDDEFPSNRIAWESLAERGVEIRYVDLISADDPEQALFERCDERTRLITVSSVQYANGFYCDLDKIGAFCQANGILFCVDAIQSLGAIPFNVESCQADFVMADGHKWLMGPEGIAIFYCRPTLVEALELHQFGWHMVEKRGDYTQKKWKPASDATRFECGSPNMLGIHALRASLQHIKDVGIDHIWQQIQENTQCIINRVTENEGLELVSITEANRRSGIVTFRPKPCDAESLYRNLMDQKVICALRGGGVRFSPHYYNTAEEIDRVFDLIAQFINK